jgi:hypothetical protein
MRAFAFLVLSFLLAASLPAQEDSGMTPLLGKVFPLAKQNDRVVLTSDVLIQPRRVLPAGTVLRTIYTPPNKNDDDVQKQRERFKIAEVYKSPSQTIRPGGELTPEEAAAYNRAYKTIWDSEDFFRASFERLNRDRYRLVCTLPGSEEILLEPLDFPQGMFFSGSEGKIRVLAVENESLAAKAGITGGMEILAVNGEKAPSTLAEFAPFYLAQRDKVQAGNRRFVLRVRTNPEAEPKEITITLPMSLNSNFWESR